MRPARTQQKISGRLRSEQATRHRYAIRGYLSTLSTAANHGINAFTALRDALTGNAWMPPIPADAWIPPAARHAAQRKRTLRISQQT